MARRRRKLTPIVVEREDQPGVCAAHAEIRAGISRLDTNISIEAEANAEDLAAIEAVARATEAGVHDLKALIEPLAAAATKNREIADRADRRANEAHARMDTYRAQAALILAVVGSAFALMGAGIAMALEPPAPLVGVARVVMNRSAAAHATRTATTTP